MADQVKKRRKWWIPVSIITTLLITGIVGFFVVTCNTQLIINVLQKAYYGDRPINSYEPYFEPHEGLTSNGQYEIAEINYDSENPNSFLDIRYPNENLTESRPTVFYYHGGGFFAGGKGSGDPLAIDEANAMLYDIVSEGFNLINVDYSLVPEYHFPTPLIQFDRSIKFIDEHKDEYHIDMNNIILMGSSAGAIMVAQYSAMMSSDEYAQLVGFTPYLKAENTKAVIVDDAPLDYDSFSLGTKFIIGNYVKGSIYLSKEDVNKYNSINHITGSHIPTICLAGEYRHDMLLMSEKLKDVGVDYLLIDPYPEHGQQPHCFMGAERTDDVAKDAFNMTIEFIKSKINQ